MPGVKPIFSHILTLENALIFNEYVIKDLSSLLSNRNMEDIIVVEAYPERADESVSQVNVQPTDGNDYEAVY